MTVVIASVQDTGLLIVVKELVSLVFAVGQNLVLCTWVKELDDHMRESDGQHFA